MHQNILAHENLYSGDRGGEYNSAEIFNCRHSPFLYLIHMVTKYSHVERQDVSHDFLNAIV